MKRFALILLASSSLTSVSHWAGAAVYYDSTSGFGAASPTATQTGPGETLFVGDVNYAGTRWFEVPSFGADQSLHITFTAARQSSYGVPYDHLAEGASLPTIAGTPVVTQFSGPTVTAASGSSLGTSYPTGYQPRLTIYSAFPSGGAYSSEGGSQNIAVQIDPPAFSNYDVPTGYGSSEGYSVPGGYGSSEGYSAPVSDSFAVDLVLPAGNDLFFGFSYDFDWTLDVISTEIAAVPEPATTALLPLAAAAAAAARRRRRVI